MALLCIIGIDDSVCLGAIINFMEAWWEGFLLRILTLGLESFMNVTELSDSKLVDWK